MLIVLVACVTKPEPVAATCVDCHGQGENPAPPVSLGGGSNPSWIGVGAHATHVEGTVISTPVACGDCHPPVTAIDSPGHIDDPWPAEVGWNGVAKAREFVVAKWDHDAPTCTVYCHQAATPTWTLEPGVVQIKCGDCHDNPPIGHPEQAEDELWQGCGGCHPGPAPGTHVNGVVDVSLDDAAPCTSACHGTGNELAPPMDTRGNVAATATGVGAHAIHGDPGEAAPVACADCHVVPATTDAPGHMDPSLPAEVEFAGVAVADGSNPTWDGASCSNTYCHGNVGGGAFPDPDWTTVDGSQVACGGCHGVPPPSHGPGDTACEDCHGSVAGAGPVIATPARHVDGNVDFN